MNKEITKKLKCIVMRNSIEIWKEEERLNNLIDKLVSTQKIGFIRIEEEIINSADIVGVFTPKTMEEFTRRKNGQWKCKYSTWHNRGEICNCSELKRYEKYKGKYKEPKKQNKKYKRVLFNR